MYYEEYNYVKQTDARAGLNLRCVTASERTVPRVVPHIVLIL